MKPIDAGLGAGDSPLNVATTNLSRRFEYLFHALVIIILMGAFFPLIRSMFGSKLNLLQSDPIQNIVLTAIYVLVLFSLCLRLQDVLFIFASTPALWLLLLWATLSVLWSDFPAIALRRALAIWLTSFYGLLLYLRFELKQLLRLFGAVLLVTIIGSLVLLVIFPAWAIMGTPLLGSWRGVFVHKTLLGLFSALAFLVAGYLLISSRSSAEKMIWGLLAGCSLITLLGSQSLSALVIVAMMAVSILFFKLLFSRKKHARLWLLLLIMISAVVVIYVALNYTWIMNEELNKDPSLSGRIPLWRMLVEKIARRPWLGYGYGSFWVGTEGPAADIWKRLSWEVPHGHNGYLDLWLHLGLPGICLGLYLLLQMVALSVRNLFAAIPGAWFWVLLSLYLIVYNLVESIFMSVNSLFWVWIVYSYVALNGSRLAPARDGAGAETFCRVE